MFVNVEVLCEYESNGVLKYDAAARDLKLRTDLKCFLKHNIYFKPNRIYFKTR